MPDKNVCAMCVGDELKAALIYYLK